MSSTPLANPQTNPNHWVRFKSIAYLCGRGISFGASGILPSAALDLHKYAINADVIRDSSVDVCDDEFGLFAPASMDFVFVGKRLGVMADPAKFLRELSSKLRLGGHLIVHVTLDSQEDGYCPFSAQSLREIVARCGAYVLKDSYERNGECLAIFKRVPGSKGVTLRKRSSAKRACIARYGALGDAIQLTPLIRALHEDGYEVTMNVTPYAADLLKHNPYVSNFVFQERDAIPNPDLGAYWREWAGEYDKYINLSESIEGRLLFVEGRKEFYTSQAFRHSVANRNYHDHHMALGGYAGRSDLQPELFFTRAEERDMQETYKTLLKNKFVLLWAVNGSSHHKAYPLMQPVLTDWLASHPDALVLSMGEKASKAKEFKHPQVVNTCGEWGMRSSALCTKYAQCVIGPESFLLNAASCFDTPKITMLSHSSHENLCKHWRGDYCLAPDTALSPCYPCHQLHYSLDSCPQVMLSDSAGSPGVTGPSCAMGAISGERVIARLNEVYAKWRS